MRDADVSPVHGHTHRNRSVETEKIIPLLWEAPPCCDAKGYEPETMKDCPNCDTEPFDNRAVCFDCQACMHCGAEPEPTVGVGARHLCCFKMMHNGHEWRTQWMVRVKAGTPGSRTVGHDGNEDIHLIEFWLDFDLGLWDEVVWSTRKEEILRGADMTREEHEALADGTLREKLK
jgi:hypothetical protein